MTKAKRYTKVINGFIRAELQDGYLYADGNVEYFIYHSKVSGIVEMFKDIVYELAIDLRREEIPSTGVVVNIEGERTKS